jgi:putative nucleotidyltransferase with HDIG domain
MELSGESRAQLEQRVESLTRALSVHKGVLPSREEALLTMKKHTTSSSLRGHMLGVEESMKAYARKLGEDEQLYGITGLLHDHDYEAHPDPTEHPVVGCERLHQMGYPVEVIEAIMGHASYTGVRRESLLAKTLFAVDELTGFLTAVAYLRPTGLGGLKFKSFKKKFKTPGFAAGVDRQEVEQGAAELGVDMAEHVLFLANALQERFPEYPKVDEFTG